MKFLIISILVLTIASCTKKSTPEKVLNDFINYRFESSQSKDDLLEMTTGQLYQKIDSLEGKELEEFLDSKDLKKKKLKVLLKNCEGEQCFLTYVLGYGQGAANPQDFGIEVKKIAKVERDGQVWKVSEVSNVKTYIEAKKELGISSEGESQAP